jgi:hypothetical protein
LSRGGGQALAYLNEYGDTNEFAAVATISADFAEWSTPSRQPPCDKVARTPLWVFVGEDDDVVPHWMSRNAALYINRTCSPAEQARVTEYPGAGHIVWDLTYNLTGMKPGLTSPDFDSYPLDTYSWLIKHERNPSRSS